jgi:hypothetical protein
MKRLDDLPLKDLMRLAEEILVIRDVQYRDDKYEFVVPGVSPNIIILDEAAAVTYLQVAVRAYYEHTLVPTPSWLKL